MRTGVFLFTDIEGSTRQWLSDPTGMQSALARHDDLILRAVQGADGMVFKHTGDGIVASFPTVASAVSAAVAAQRELRRTTATGEGLDVRVRMAVHAGDAEPVGDDWFGPALNHAARLLGLGHGDQVLMTDAARSLCVDFLPPHVNLINLGLHHLRDLPQPERVWQVAWEGGRRTFPPLRSLSPFAGHLPPPLTPFIGRSVEVAEVAGMVLEHRLTTITGPGGVGKTRVAVVVAEQVRSRFPGGVWLIELAPIENGVDLRHAVLGAVGAELLDGHPTGDLLDRCLAGRPALFVLDNCEHLAEHVALMADDVLREAPAITMLATSRQALGLPVEQVRLLGPLSPPDRVDLFTERAVAAGHHPGGDDAAVQEVCDGLDGLPLAIELAAARLRSMTLSELIERLPQRLRLLTGTRPHEPRHASLQAMIDWSYDQLPAIEQQLFVRLSVFGGDFDLAAAHSVAGGPATDDLDTLAGLDALVNKSLVLVTDHKGHSRYRLLETLRQYGESRLGDETEGARRRHAAYYATLIPLLKERSSRLARGELSELIGAELANIRIAFAASNLAGDHSTCLSIVSELAPFAQLRPTLELAEWAQLVVTQADDLLDLRVVRAHLTAAGIRTYLADWRTAERHARQAVWIAEQLGSGLVASALLTLVPPLEYQGRLEEGLSIARRGVEAAERTDRPVVQAAARYVRLFPDLYRGHVPTDDELAGLAAHAERSTSPAEYAHALGAYGTAALRRGEPNAAAILERAAAAADFIGHLHLRCLHRTYQVLAEAGGDPSRVLRALRVALIEYRAAGIPLGSRQLAAELLHAFAPLGRWTTLAILDGASPPVSLYPVEASASRSAARDALGHGEYERWAARGRAMGQDQFESFVHGELDDVGVERSAKLGTHGAETTTPSHEAPSRR